jgi:hypothetical protein
MEIVDIEPRILEAVEADPETSTRRLALLARVPHHACCYVGLRLKISPRLLITPVHARSTLHLDR